MKNYRPKMFTCMHKYNGKQFFYDVKSGIIVAIIALPLSIAFALGCGVPAEKGVYSAIISSILIALFGGSRVQITGPTGAFIVITQSVLVKYDFEGLMLATIMAGIMLVLMGIFKIGKLIKYIPSPITIGFTAGIGVTIFTLEVKDFLGLTIDSMPTNFIGKWSTYISHFKDINWQSVMLSLCCIIVLVIWPKINKTIPNSLIAIIVGTLIARVSKLDVKTLGEISNALPTPSVPNISLDLIFELMPNAFTIAILIALQALLSAVVTDELISSKTNSSAELIGEGIANAVLGFFGCIPATGGVARSIANAKNGARTPVAAIVHGITLFAFLMLLMPLIKFVPLCVLSAILIVVSYNMLNIKAFIAYSKSTKSDFIVLLTACILTFAFDLVFAIEVGMVLACALFMKRMSDVTQISNWVYKDAINDDAEDTERIGLKDVPKHTLVFEVSGPLFFGATDKFLNITKNIEAETKVVVMRMRSVPAIDTTALNSLMDLKNKLSKKNITLVLSHVNEQPLTILRRTGFNKDIGELNICSNIDVALERAKKICEETA
ncbi:MAG: STAS domain-containing protein [Lachnospira sp.]|nr:STAS domain-containing protein [Lachnospira sp.]